VVAVGNPFGLGGTVTAGIDIGAGPYDPMNKGNSGSPTFDVDGNVIGVNTATYSPRFGRHCVRGSRRDGEVRGVSTHHQGRRPLLVSW
jgi:S1-C subfamily serine protease